jgi:pSer/pThr/pTyr-binding forkhead associated (FHA) protein
MRDGLTLKTPEAGAAQQQGAFLARHRAILVLLTGPSSGSEFVLKEPRITLGRGPGVDLAFADTQMSRQHAALDLTEDGYCVRDLGSTNGTLVNGEKVESKTLSHGDRMRIGGSTFQYVVSERSAAKPNPPNA